MHPITYGDINALLIAYDRRKKLRRMLLGDESHVLQFRALLKKIIKKDEIDARITSQALDPNAYRQLYEFVLVNIDDVDEEKASGELFANLQSLFVHSEQHEHYKNDEVKTFLESKGATFKNLIHYFHDLNKYFIAWNIDPMVAIMRLVFMYTDEFEEDLRNHMVKLLDFIRKHETDLACVFQSKSMTASELAGFLTEDEAQINCLISDEARLLHPVLSIIPQTQWDIFFKNKLRITEVPKAKNPGLEGIKDIKASSKEKKFALLLSCCWHLTAERLIAFSREAFECDDETIMYVSAVFGRIDCLEVMGQGKDRSEPYLLKSDKPSQWAKAVKMAFFGAVCGGHINIIEWLLREYTPQGSPRDLIFVDNYRCMQLALEHGQLAILEWFIQAAPESVDYLYQRESSNGFDSGLTLHQEAVIRGDLAVVGWLIAKRPESLAILLKKGTFTEHPFLSLVIRGDAVNMLPWIAKTKPDYLSDMMSNSYYFNKYFCMAAQSGSWKVFKWLAENHHASFQSVMRSTDEIIIHAAKNGNIAMLQYCADHASQKFLEYLQHPEVIEALEDSAARGDLSALKWVAKKYRKVFYENLLPKFSSAYTLGYKAHLRHRIVLKWLIDKKRSVMSDSTELFDMVITAARYSHLDLLRWMNELHPDMMAFDRSMTLRGYPEYYYAALNQHHDIVDWLHALNPRYFENAMIAPDRTPSLLGEALRPFTRDFMLSAVKRELNRLHREYASLQWSNPGTILEIADEKRSQLCLLMMQAIMRNRFVFEWDEFAFLTGPVKFNERMVSHLFIIDNFFLMTALQYGAPYLLEWIEDHYPKIRGYWTSHVVSFRDKDELLAALVKIVEINHLGALQWLLRNNRTSFVYLLTCQNDYLFIEALKHGDKPVIDFLYQTTGRNYNQLIRNEHFPGVFLEAVRAGRLGALQWLKEVSPQRYGEFLTPYVRSLLENASHCQHINVIDWFLAQPSAFTLVMSENSGLDQHLLRFTRQTLATLRVEYAAFRLANTHAVFDVANPERAQLLNLMVKVIIRINERALDNDLRFLLTIPSVRALAHRREGLLTGVALLNLANRYNNREAATILMEIPAVRALAEQQNIPQPEAHPVLNLRAVANNPESSMLFLSAGERAQLAEAFNHYNNLMNDGLIDRLRETLKARYLSNPAFVLQTGRLLMLPCDYQAFMALPMSEEERKAAFIAYYKHDDHTALRYLSKPNLWMSPEALVVYSNDEGRWSGFVDCLPLISLYYLAAIDAEMPCIKDFTLETKLENFIRELALIGRAHNWDKERAVIQRGKSVMEKYDDGEGDKPSCNAGTKGRLYNSVPGNALVVMVSVEDIREEVRSFALNYFKSKLNAENILELMSLLDKAFALEEDVDLMPLAELNIPDALIAEFRERLYKQYRMKLTEDSRLLRILDSNLILDFGSTDPFDQYHVLKLCGLTNIYQYIVDQYEALKFDDEPAPTESSASTMSVSARPAPPSLAEVGLFANNGDQVIFAGEENNLGNITGLL